MLDRYTTGPAQNAELVYQRIPEGKTNRALQGFAVVTCRWGEAQLSYMPISTKVILWQ